jgi:DNA-binding transcriptional ArsR family regulator
MTRLSTIDKLQAPIRAEINRLRIDCGFTIDQILGHLRAMSVKVSRSAMGRHIRKIEEAGDKIREARAVAEGVASAIGDDNDGGKLARLNIELLHSAAMRIMSANSRDGGDVEFTPMEVMLLGKALDHLAKAQKTDAERVLKVRKETAEKALKAVDTELKKQKLPGLTKETIASIREKVLGVAA